MTTKADFSEQEWDLIREAPVDAGMVVITAGSNTPATAPLRRPMP